MRMWPKTIRRKIVSYSLLIILIMSVITAYATFNARSMSRDVDELYRSTVASQAMQSDLEFTEKYLVEYLSTKTSDSLREFIKYENRFRADLAPLNRTAKPDETALLEKNLVVVGTGYLEEADAAISAKRGRNIPVYIAAYEESDKSAAVLRYLIGRISSVRFNQSLAAYEDFNARTEALIRLVTLMIASAVILTVLIVIVYSRRIADPIIRLAHAANEIARGNFDDRIAVRSADDEIATMAEAFITMQESIRRYVAELHEKAEVEKNLMEERFQMLHMKNLLKNAELDALQSQINPHFLFNTMNAAIQLAVVEDAERTRLFLEHLSAFLRFTMRPLSNTVTLGEELTALDSYIYLLKIRFPDRISFTIDRDEGTETVRIPSLILQPLVENSVLHGLSERESGGEVGITARRDDGRIRVDVSDNGSGMSADQVAELLRVRPERAEQTDHGAAADPMETAVREEQADVGRIHGIGLRNVIDRLRLFYGIEDCVRIQSRRNEGTVVSLYLPAFHKREEAS
jgi:two-component system, sensor histidine kinase YesM